MGGTDDVIADTSDGADSDLVVGDAVAAKVVAIVADVLHVSKDALGLDTVAADVEGWDSFGHVRIVLAVDKAFDISLSMGAIEQAASIAGLVEAVERARRES